MTDLQPGDIVQSKLHPVWIGSVVSVSENSYAVLVQWDQPGGGHIRSWAYWDTVIVIKRGDRQPSRYEKAIIDRKKPQ